MAQSDCGSAPGVSSVEIIRAEVAKFRIVVHVPLDAQIVDCLEAQAGDDRGEIASVREKGDSAQIERGVEDIATIGNERAAKIRIDKEFLRNLPACPFTSGGFAIANCSLGFRTWRRVERTQIKPLRQRIANLVRICSEVGRI